MPRLRCFTAYLLIFGSPFDAFNLPNEGIPQSAPAGVGSDRPRGALLLRAHAAAFARFLGVEKVGFFRSGDNATDCLARVKPWLARLRAYAASDARPADGGFDGVARACTDGDDRSCAAAWRRRAEHGAAALGRKHPTVVPRLLATCA